MKKKIAITILASMLAFGSSITALAEENMVEPSISDEIEMTMDESQEMAEELVGITIPTSGQCGTDATWSIDEDGVLTISGTGSFSSTYYSTGEQSYIQLAGYTTIKKVVIESGITEIGADAFNIRKYNSARREYKYYNDAIESISIPDTVTYIGNNAFYNCRAIKNIELPDSITYIGASAFAECYSLESMTIPSKVEEVSSLLFENCHFLTSVTLDEGVIFIAKEAFKGCNRLHQVYIPTTVTTVGSQAFVTAGIDNDVDDITLFFTGTACDFYKKANLAPDWVRNSTKYTFSEGYNHSFGEEEIVVKGKEDAEGTARYTCDRCNIHYDIQYLPFRGESTLRGMLECTGACEVAVPSIIDGTKVTSIGIRAFEGNTLLGGVVIPEGVTFIDDLAFAGCSSMEYVIFPSTLKEMGSMYYSVFADCTNVKTFDLSKSSIKFLGPDLFKSAKSLEKIILPETLSDVADTVFRGCEQKFTIAGYKDTYADAYAAYYKHPFELLPGKPPKRSTSDVVAPVVTKIEVLTPEITRPGVVTYRVYFYEEGTGANLFVMVITSPISDRCLKKYITVDAEYTGYKDISFTMDSTCNVGDWEVAELLIWDNVGNPSEGYGVTPKVGFQVVGDEDMEEAFEVGLSNPKLVENIKEMDNKQTARILIDPKSEGVLKKEVFDAIKGTDKQLLIYNDQLQWIFKGKEITGEIKDINVNATISSYKVPTEDGEEGVIRIDFADNGTLPGVAHMRGKADYLYQEYGVEGNLYLYYIAPDGSLKQVLTETQGDFDGSDNWVYFDVIHNSSYILSGKKLADSGKDDSIPNAGNNTSGSNSNNNGSGSGVAKDPTSAIVTERFADVPEGKWYVDAVQYVLDNGIMSGIKGTDNFDPEGSCTRAMMVTILYRSYGSPDVSSLKPASELFSDVSAGAWYEPAITWAYHENVTTGTVNPAKTESGIGVFGTEDDVTREQLATFLMRFAAKKGFDAITGQDKNLSDGTFEDDQEISGFAKAAMSWANYNSIIGGKNIGGKKYLAPKSGATRAEVAKMIMNFQNRFGK